MRLARRPRRGVRVEMVPLMDVVFQLVVLFTYAMVSMVVPRGLRVTLPRASADANDRREGVAVTVGRRGELYVDREPVSRGELVPRVRERIADDPAREVLVYGDRAAPLGVAVEVLGLLREAGIERATFRVSPAGER